LQEGNTQQHQLLCMMNISYSYGALETQTKPMYDASKPQPSNMAAAVVPF
jgi:hypothetical protein